MNLPPDPIINKVAQSNLITIDLTELLPAEENIALDIYPFLFKGLILKEQDFRKALQELNWTEYQNKNVAVYCSTEAIIPVWAYMLLSIQLQPYAKRIVFGNLQSLEAVVIKEHFQTLDWGIYKDQRLVIKGCGDKRVPEAAFVEASRILTPIAKSITYGEACSTVPLMKRKN